MHKTLFFLIFALLVNNASFTQTEFGDTLFSFNAGLLTPTQDYTLHGIGFAEDHFWITGMNAPYYNHRLYKISADGSTLVDYTSLGSGYHGFFDMAYDGEFLYVVDRDSIVQINLNTGLPTGERIYISFYPYLLQGLAYAPDTDHFWVIPQRNGQLQIICEIDRDGNVWIGTLNGVSKISDKASGTALRGNTNNNINLHPNPTEGIFHIELDNPRKAELVIYDLQGKPIYQDRIQSYNITIDLSGYPMGMYIVRLIESGKVTVGKVFLK